jgi:heme/copper-type cytochrome/quinol oxidase subunit 3
VVDGLPDAVPVLPHHPPPPADLASAGRDAALAPDRDRGHGRAAGQQHGPRLRGAPGFAARWAAGLLLALAFAALQTWLWVGVWSAGAGPDSSIYAGLFYLLTWFHAAHVACGLVALLWVQGAAAAGRVTPSRRSTAASAATFWHFVDAVWLVLFVGFFLV